MIILVTGTPGTGKTTIASLSAVKLGFSCYNAHDEAVRLNLIESKDIYRDADIIDEKNVEYIITDLLRINNNFVLEGLISHYANPGKDRLCIIIKCDIKILNERLLKRGYSKGKIRENLDSEIFNVIETEAKEQLHNIILFDNTKELGNNLDLLLDEIKGFYDNISSK